MRTIGIAGTSKNTGKTTTALEIIRQGLNAGLNIAITGIGYDGENKDNITGLPKPRYYLPIGMHVITAERCLSEGSAGYKVKLVTEINTIFGHLVLAEITKPGMVIIAGPNTGKDLQFILDILIGQGVELTIVDGALNRIVPLIRTDGLVFSTGAALNVDITYIANHAKAIYDLFEPGLTDDSLDCSEYICIKSVSGSITELNTSSLLGSDTVTEIRNHLDTTTHSLVIPGACMPKLFIQMLENGKNHIGKSRFIFGSPLKLIASANPIEWKHFLKEAEKRDHVVEYLEKIPLLFATVNPFFPRYLQKQNKYEPAAVDKDLLLATVQARVSGIPIFDIRQRPVPNLLPLFD